jgi:hypothetical protein
MQHNYNTELGIASVTSCSGLRVVTLLQNPDNPARKVASTNAYAAARYSRSSLSVEEIATEINYKNIDSGSRLENIVHGYGHASISDLGSILVCIENISALDAAKFFYRNPTQSGQERSTRYQNFSKPSYQQLPSTVPSVIADKYNSIMQSCYNAYNTLLPLTESALQELFSIDVGNKQELSALKSRTFDTVRYTLPVGHTTSLAAVMSARDWSKNIGWYLGSSLPNERELGTLLFELLTGTGFENTGYIPEAKELIRHAEPNNTADKFEQEFVNSFKGVPTSNYYANLFTQSLDTSFKQIEDTGNPLNSIKKNYTALLSTFSSKFDVEKFFKTFNHYNQAGNLAQTGAFGFEGVMDFGTLKDLNRHRSTERVFPLLHNAFDLDKCSNNNFFLCEYLYHNSLTDLAATYRSKISTILHNVQSFYTKYKEQLDELGLLPYIKYLLPYATATPYRMYMSVDDFQYIYHLRTRNGGHISYRSLVMGWCCELASNYREFSYLLDTEPNVRYFSHEQFIDRS